MASFTSYARRHPAATRPAKTQGDVVELPFVAALLVVDNQVAVLQTDFIEILSVQSGQAQAVEPIETGEQSARGIAVIGKPYRRTGWCARCTRRNWVGGQRRRGLVWRRRSACLSL